MTASRKDTLSRNIPSASEAVLPHPGPVALPPKSPDAGINTRLQDLTSLIKNRILRLQAKMRLREPMSGFTHCFGALLAAVGLVVLVLKTTEPFRPWHLVTYSIFGTSMVLLYAVSTLFHWLPLSTKNILQLRKLDHIMIFVFIAATYTPFCLIPFRGPFGWSVFVCIWVIAALGTVFKLYWIKVPKKICLSIYFFAGFFSLVSTGHILRTLQPWAIFWLVAGGISYTTGAIFYALEKSDDTPPFFGYHEIFHIFVMLGSSAHFWVIYRYLIEFN
jgi:hemolysin III